MSKWTHEAKLSHRQKVQGAKRRGVKLLPKGEVDRVRDTRFNLLTGDQVVEEIAPNNRAACRCCGQKILKGEARLSFTHDLIGNGSAHTASTVYMHVDCSSSNYKVIRWNADTQTMATVATRLTEAEAYAELQSRQRANCNPHASYAMREG